MSWNSWWWAIGTDAERGIELMRGDLNGRATFLVEHRRVEGAEAARNFRTRSAEAGALTQADRYSAVYQWTCRPAVALAAAHRAIVMSRRTEPWRSSWRPNFRTAGSLSRWRELSRAGGQRRKKTGAGPLALKRELREMRQLEQTKQTRN